MDVIIRFAFGSDPAYSTLDNDLLTGFKVDDITISSIVESNEVAIFFDDAGNVEEGGDFGYYASDAMNELLGTGVES